MTLRALCTRALLPIAALILCAAPAAHAAWPNSSLVNVPVRAAAGDQYASATVSDGAGGAIDAWTEVTGSDYHYYAQRMSASGTPQWPASGVAICMASGARQFLSAISDGAGGAIVTWEDYRTSSPNCAVYAQRISADGAVVWTANGVAVCTYSVFERAPVLVTDGAGGAIIAWHDGRSSSTEDIYAQRISAGGVLQWSASGVVVRTAGGSGVGPAIVADGAGGAIVTWQDNRSGGYDIYVQRISAVGVVQWTASGVALCTAGGDQLYPTIAADGMAGAIVTWADSRLGANTDIYAQRVSSGGVVQWTANGVALCTATGAQIYPLIVTDDAGGGIVSWCDQRSGTYYDLYAQRISPAGSVQWAANGVAVCTAPSWQVGAAIIRDGTGGAIVGWADYRAGNNTSDVYAQRISSAGLVQWTVDGVAVCVASYNQDSPVIVTDGAGGVIATWSDYRSGTQYDVYSQRVDRWGYLGVQPPGLSVRDVPNDEGGQVSVYWNASPLDSFPLYAISNYWIWRQVPSSLAQAALARGARMLSEGASTQDAARGALRTTTAGTNTYYWELVSSQLAQGFPGYSYVAPTTCDSVAGANPKTVFMVEARGVLAQQWWFSDPDSGYSVDNLAPAAPTPFTGQYLGGTTRLHWGVSAAADFSTFRLYRGYTGFVPGPGNLVVTKTDTGYVDVAGGPYLYKLCAVDVHGNVSAYTLLQPSGTADVPGGALPRELALSAPAPNPARGSCVLRLALPRDAHVSLAVFDQQGRRVRTLADGAISAGEHPFAWDGRDDGGRAVASALYFVRLETGGRAISRRLVVVR